MTPFRICDTSAALVAASLSIHLLAPSICHAQCSTDWAAAFGVPAGTDNIVRAATSWDPDGDGPVPPSLIVGGDFGNAGGVSALRIARFDEHRWRQIGTPSGASAAVRALMTWDTDGPGPLAPSVIAGGEFGSMGPVSANRVASWNGATWMPFSSGITGGAGIGVFALALWDPDGPGPLAEQLVVGGNFITTGAGLAVNRVSIWDGAAWQALGSGFNNNVNALAVYDPDGPGPMTPRLVAAGSFTFSGATPLNRIAWWDGSAWQPFASGFSNTVNALTVWDADGPGPNIGQLVATGSFTMSGATTRTRIALWDGAAWQSLLFGIDAAGTTVGTWDPDDAGPQTPLLVASGNFTTVGGVPITRIARWNGVAWQGFANGMDSAALALTAWDSDADGPLAPSLIAVGGMVTAGTRTVDRVMRWDSAAWQTVGHGLSGNGLQALAHWDPDGAGPLPRQLIAGGSFAHAAGDTNVRNIARWENTLWRPLGIGTNGTVSALTTWDPDDAGPLAERIVAGGSFSMAGGIIVNKVASFDGSAWQPFASGITSGNSVLALTTWDPDGPGAATSQVIVGGDFTMVNGMAIRSCAGWDGAVWTNMGSGFVDFGAVRALATWSPTGLPADTRLYAAGAFGSGGFPPRYLAEWNGTSWIAVQGGPGNATYALAPWSTTALGRRLLLGGIFQVVNNTVPLSQHFANRVGAYDGTLLSGPFENGLNDSVNALTTWDPDGPGPLEDQVVAAGIFSGTVLSIDPPPIIAPGIARWTGSAWAPFGVGTAEEVSAVTTWDPDGPGPLYPTIVGGGGFQSVGGGPSPRITALVAQPPAISAQPAAPGGVMAGDDVMLTVGVAGIGPDFAYRWKKGGVDLNNGPTGSGSTISGVYSAVLVISDITCTVAGDYSVMVGNACGNVTSSVTTLAVNPCTPACPGDANGDNMVGLGDVAALIVHWAETVPPAPLEIDLDGSGDIGIGDLAMVITNWGTSCP